LTGPRTLAYPGGMSTRVYTSGVVLLVETVQGGSVAVRFPNAKAARDWEDENGVNGLGVAPYLSSNDALKVAAR
jgi:hypothetical protein